MKVQHGGVQPKCDNQLPPFEFTDDDGIPALLEGQEGDDRGYRSILLPVLAAGFFSLGVYLTHPHEHHDEKRSEQHQGGHITIGDDMN